MSLKFHVSRMAEYFGMIYYGCCDRLDDRLDIVKDTECKKVSCSPWGQGEIRGEHRKRHHHVNKPAPAFRRYTVDGMPSK